MPSAASRQQLEAWIPEDAAAWLADPSWLHGLPSSAGLSGGRCTSHMNPAFLLKVSAISGSDTVQCMPGLSNRMNGALALHLMLLAWSCRRAPVD